MKICQSCLGFKKIRDVDFYGVPEGPLHPCPACKGTGEEKPKYVNPATAIMKDLVKDNKKVHFSFYRDKEFWYEHEDGLIFPIALSEVDNPKARATLLAEDKAIYFMRWIKKYIDACKAEATK